MRAYLSIYCDAAAAPPLSKTLNRWARQRPWATASISVATVALECGLIPLTLVMPPRWRALGTATMVCMHVGIAALMSFRVGLVFFTTFPAYVVGFRCAASPCTPGLKYIPVLSSEVTVTSSSPSRSNPRCPLCPALPPPGDTSQ